MDEVLHDPIEQWNTTTSELLLIKRSDKLDCL
jgi:hypothetical protein